MNNAMRDQVLSLPDLMRTQYSDLEPKARKVLTTPQIFNVQHIILTGCGDSYAACMAMKTIFEHLTKIRTDVIKTIDLARFTEKKFLGGAPGDPLVIGVSNSGKVTRMGEAMERVRSYGAFVLGITKNLDAPLGKQSDAILQLDIPNFASAPGTRSYMVSVMALYLMAIRIGEVRGRYTMDVARSYRKDILKQADKLEQLLPEMDKKAKNIAEEWKDFTAFDFVGAGFDEAAAFFGQAKVFEATGDRAVSINTEEWLHLNFFMNNPDKIATTLFATVDNPAWSRSKEVAGYMKQLGRSLLIITDGDKNDFGVDASYIKIPLTDHHASMPLTQFVPICLIFSYLMDLKKTKAGRGCEGPWSFSKGAACVRQSEIVIK